MAGSTTAPVRQGRRPRVNWGAYLFLLPAFVLFAVFVAYPIGFNTYLSLHNWNGVSDVWEWVGLEHFGRLPEERTIRLSLRNSGFFFAGHLVNMAIALLLAVLLNNPIPGRNLAPCLFPARLVQAHDPPPRAQQPLPAHVQLAPEQHAYQLPGSKYVGADPPNGSRIRPLVDQCSE